MPQEQPTTRPVSGNAIRKYRLIRGLHQRELGARIGATQGQVSGWETGVVVPELDKAIAIAVVLGRPVEHLFYDLYLGASDQVMGKTSDTKA